MALWSAREQAELLLSYTFCLTVSNICYIEGESNPRLQLGKGLASSQPSCVFVVTSEQNSNTRVCARFAQTFAQSKISRLI
jgi:hypothetical protein